MLIIILFNWQLILDDPFGFLIAFIPWFCFLLILLVPSIVFHEISHGLMASWLGDDTAKNMGRLSLNPLSHLDRRGAQMFLIIGLGSAKPVPINPYRLNMDPRKGMAIVAAAGPLSNFIIAFLCAMVFRLEFISLPVVTNEINFSDVPALVLLLVIQINVLLAIFNLLPVPPFDGFRIAVGVLPKEQAAFFARAERYSLQILIGLVILLFTTGFLWIITEFFTNALLGQEYY